MTKAYVQEFAGLAPTGFDPVSIVPSEPIAKYVVDYTAGVAASPAFQPATRFVKIAFDSIASASFGAVGTVATVSDPRYNANENVTLGVSPGRIVSIITNT
jgi:hypothetical protein